MTIDYNSLSPEDQRFLDSVAQQAENDALVDAGLEAPQAFISKEASYQPEVVEFYNNVRTEVSQNINQMTKTASECEAFVADIYTTCFYDELQKAASEWENSRKK